MTRGLLILLASAVPHWVLSTWCGACDGESEQKIMFVAGSDGAGRAHAAAGEPHVVIARAPGDGQGMGFVTAHAVASAGDGEPRTWTKRIVLNKASSSFEDPNRGWLGVAVSSVPESLAAQLGEAEGGAVISNIVKDSPADRAGLRVHDIIISVNGTAIRGDEENTVLQTANLIGVHKPGETIDIVVIREGQEQTIRAVLGSRPNLQDVDWKVETLPLAKIEDQVKALGKVFRMEPGGGWVLKDLGDLHALGDLHEHLQLWPKTGNYSMKVFIDGGRKTIRTESHKDGTTLKVEQVDDGEITVTRVDATGKESIATYASVDELRARDAEAAELFENSAGKVIVQVEADGVDGIADFRIELDDHMEELTEKLESSFEQAQEAYRRAMEELHEAMTRMTAPSRRQDGEDRDTGAFFKSKPFAWPLVPPGPFVLGAAGQARQSIEVRPDGSIEVRVRKGDSELVRVFTNEADLQQRDAKLYEKYKDLLEADEE